MSIGKETNIGFSIASLMMLGLVIAHKLSWWNLFNPPILYFVMWLMVRETKKQASERRKTGYFKWDELSEDAKKTFHKTVKQ